MRVSEKKAIEELNKLKQQMNVYKPETREIGIQASNKDEAAKSLTKKILNWSKITLAQNQPKDEKSSFSKRNKSVDLGSRDDNRKDVIIDQLRK